MLRPPQVRVPPDEPRVVACVPVRGVAVATVLPVLVRVQLPLRPFEPVVVPGVVGVVGVVGRCQLPL